MAGEVFGGAERMRDFTSSMLMPAARALSNGDARKMTEMRVGQGLTFFRRFARRGPFLLVW